MKEQGSGSVPWPLLRWERRLRTCSWRSLHMWIPKKKRSGNLSRKKGTWMGKVLGRLKRMWKKRERSRDDSSWKWLFCFPTFCYYVLLLRFHLTWLPLPFHVLNFLFSFIVLILRPLWGMCFWSAMRSFIFYYPFAQLTFYPYFWDYVLLFQPKDMNNCNDFCDNESECRQDMEDVGTNTATNTNTPPPTPPSPPLPR